MRGYIKMIIDIIFSFCFGCLFGIINAWNKKVMFVLLLILILIIIVGAVTIPSEELETAFSLGSLVVRGIATFVGMWVGQVIYEETFE